MAAASEDALTCDLAETYGVLNWRALPVRLAATLAAGLGDGSRSKMHLRGEHACLRDVLLAAIADGVNTISWQLAGGGEHSRPQSLLAQLLDPAATAPDAPGYEDTGELLAALYPQTHSAFEEVK